MSSSRSLLGRILLDDIGIKIISLLMAGVLWLYAVSEQEQTKTLTVPVELLGTDSGHLQVTGEIPKSVRVVVAGKGSDLIRLVGEDLKVVLNLKDEPDGDVTVSLHPSDVVGPDNLTLHYVSIEGGNDIALHLLHMVEKQVSVRVKHMGAPPPGLSYFIGFNVAANARVTLVGPKSILGEIDSVETEPVDLNGHSSDFNMTVRLISPSPEVHIRDNDQVDLKVRIMPTTPVIPSAIVPDKTTKEGTAPNGAK